MADKTFSIVFDASMNVSQMSSSIKKIQQELGKVQLGGAMQKNFTGLLVELESAIKNFETKSGKEISSKKEITEIENSVKRIVNLYERLKIEAKSLSGLSGKELQKLFPDDLDKGFKQVQDYLNKYESAVEKNNKEIEALQKKARAEQEKLAKAQQKDALKGKQKVTAVEMRSLKNEQSKAYKDWKKQKEIIDSLNTEKEARLSSGAMRIKKDGTADKRYGDAEGNQKLLQDIQEAQLALSELENKYNKISSKIGSSISETDYEDNVKKIQEEIKASEDAISSFQKQISELKAGPEVQQSFEKLREEVEKLTGQDLSGLTQDLDGLEKLKEVFADFQTGKIDEVRQKLEGLVSAVDAFKDGADGARGASDNLGSGFAEMTRQAQDLARLQDQILDFFSISNTVQIFKDAVRDAFETVKELDAVMTETAVVTDFDIGDMWDKLPEYSDEANKLGTSIKSLYEATTLYYQQGLNSDQAMGVGIETMKMARIANMDAAAATEAMTAALRGFNMEINEINAQRINDVYSELAAITAADTEQIATAMSKTASIAASANMEFETTAAFLAQIIETTQEAPETAGTAMKTIIARFTEVKQLFDEGMLSGKDSEGEEININKIDAALRTVGISLKDFLNGTKGIDDIFLELASKWDTLDLATQRYIATTAAGSRQQSRFLAMMSNYDRTMELVTAANNSAGASQEQFDKTLESLEAKLQRLSNAWQEFTMGLANNEAIKTGVDLLTLLLETINKITGVAGNEGLGGIVTMFTRLVTVIGALRGGSKVSKGLMGGIAKSGVFNENILKNLGMTEAGEWTKDISLAQILMKSLDITVQKTGITFNNLSPTLAKVAAGLQKIGVIGAASGASATIGWLPFIGVVAAVTAAVWLLVKAFQAVQATTPEGKLEAAAQAANDAADAAENAAQAYEHLASAMGSIKGKQSALKGMAVGTSEWKSAVQDLNGEILNLVEQYPELTSFVDSSGNYLTLKETNDKGETLDSTLDKYEQKKYSAQSASAAANLQKQQRQQDYDYSQLNASIREKHATIEEGKIATAINTNLYSDDNKAITGNILKENREEVDKIARAIASNQISVLEESDDGHNVTVKTKTGETATYTKGEYEDMKKYGQGLVASDNVQKAQASSIISNALASSDVSEEMTKNVMGAFTSDRISNMIKTEQNDLRNMTGDEWEEAKEKYAASIGYTYSEGNLYKGEAIAANKLELSKEDLIAQMAGVNVTGKLSDNMTDLDKKMANLSPEEAALASVFSSKNLDNLTVGQLESLMGTSAEDVAGWLGYTPEEYATALGYAGVNEHQADIAEFQADAETQMGQFNELLGGDWVKNNLSNATFGTLQGLEDQTRDMAPNAAKEYLQSFADSISNSNLSKEAQDALSSYLSSVDWSNMTEALNAMDYMKNLGLDEAAIKSFWDVATKGAKTYISSMSEALSLAESFQNKINKADDIEQALEQGTATNEQMQELIDAGVDVSGYELTAEGWRASEEEAAKATKTMREYYAIQAQESLELTKQQIADAKTKQKLLEYNGVLPQGEDGKFFAGALDLAKARDIAGIFGVDEKSYEGDTNAFVAAIQAELDSIINRLNNGEQIVGMAEKIAAMTGAAGLTTDENVAMGGTAESVHQSMQQEALDLGLDPQEVANYSESMRQMYDLTSQVADQMAIDYARMAQAMGEVTSKWDEWQEKLNKNNDWEATGAFKEMAKAANDMLGVTDVLDAEFFKLEENMKLLKRAAEGDAEAFDALQKAAGKKLVQNLRKVAKESDNIHEMLDDLDETIENFNDEGIEVGDVVKMDDIETSYLANQLSDMYSKAYNAVLAGTGDLTAAMEAGNAAVEAAGYEAPEMVPETETVTTELPPDIIASSGGSVTGGLNNSMTGGTILFDAQPNAPVTYKYTRMVPKEGGFTKKAETPHASGGGGGGGGGGGKKEPWKNSFDKLHNISENIDRTTREREKIELRYQRLLDRRIAKASDLLELSQSEIESLKEQASYQNQMVAGREEQLREYLEKNKSKQKYATYDFETQMVLIDWDRINKVTDQEKGEEIEEYVSQLEEWRDSLQEAQDALEEIEDAVWEIEQRGREEYLEFEDRVKEAVVAAREKEIETLEEINESINDTNADLLDAIQQSIDKMRQDRENEKTEENLQEKQRQLAYLEQDTSGANAMAILELQEEIRQDQEDYTDTLIDQKISELQEQNDKAAEQREKQITLLQNQLDWEVETGRIWQVVEELMQDGLDPQGGLIRGSALEAILKEADNWKGLSDIGQMNWLLDLETMIAESMNWRMTYGQLENQEEKLTGQEITFKDANGNVLTGKVDEKGQVWTADDKYYKNVYKWIDGTYHTTESSATTYTAPKVSTSSGSSGSSSGSGSSSNTKGGGAYVPPYTASYTTGDGTSVSLGAYNTAAEAEKAIEQALKKTGEGTYASGAVKNSSGTTQSVRTKSAGDADTGTPSVILPIKRYATGGLANFTGPAWLDGTKSRPELVLNQRDTQNFIQLKDILSSIMSRGFTSKTPSTENNGDITYDIDINVETMRSDYDVEQVATKIKSMINEDARYRNNNAVSLKR